MKLFNASMCDDIRRAYLALKSECSFRSGAIGGAPANGRSWIRLKSKRVSTCSPMANALLGFSVRETSELSIVATTAKEMIVITKNRNEYDFYTLHERKNYDIYSPVSGI